ncbi:MAG: VCBS repeat-containing protein [Candidatus Marinimicrobia bacterium]|nr:VCBS repeat-containing protein [Candidatus Neomarinimicrobiota bacterium]
MKKILFTAKAVLSAPILFCFLSTIVLAERSYLTINGTYDFDGDGFSEFLSLEKADPEDVFPKVAAYYEIDDLGEHTEIWRYNSPVSIAGVSISDMDGDGTPEITVVENYPLSGSDETHSLVQLFSWVNGNFSQSASITWKPSGEKLPLHPTSLAVVDLDNDGRDEIAIALGSPIREIRLLTLDVSVDPSALRVSSTLTSEQLASGYGRIVLSIADKNQDGFMDLVAVSQEMEEIITEVFENTGGRFSKQMSYKKIVASLIESRTTLNTYSVTSTDVNQDGQLDVVLPFHDGSASALYLSADSINLIPLDPTIAGLFHISTESLTNVDVNEILLARAELGIGGMKARRLKFEAIAAKKVLGESESAQPKPVRQLELTSMDKEEIEDVLITTEEVSMEEVTEAREESEEARLKQIRQLELTSLDQKAVDEVLLSKDKAEESTTTEESIEAIEDKTPGIAGRVQKVELRSLTREGETPPAGPTITLPPDATISDTLFSGMEFTLPLDNEEGKKFRAFRPRVLPRGATFDPTSRSIIWTPKSNQVGLHRFAYDVEYEIIGKRVEIAETDIELQVVTKTESLSKEIYIWVEASSEEGKE